MKHRAVFDKRAVLAMHAASWGLTFEVDDARQPFERRENVAIVSIEGPLTHHDDWWWDSYDAIKARVGAALESPADTVVLRIDSPGGVVSGCYDTARELRAMAKAKGKRLVAYADGMAASAGYALACAASEIYLPSTGFVGSIGVINTLFDAVEFERKLGFNYAVIASGERKRFGHPSVPISDAAIANAQREVDLLAGLFFELVAEARPVSVQELAALEAGLLIGAEAVAAKLADGVCTFDELIARLAGRQNDDETAARGSASPPTSEVENMSWKEALKKAAEEGDEEAKKALAALEENDEQESKAEDDKDDDMKEPQAEDDQSDDERKEAKALDSNLQLLATVQSLAAWKASVEEREERRQLMASRPDFAPDVVAWLERQPLSVVRDAVKTLPRGAVPAKGGQVGAARAALGVSPREAIPPDGAQTLPPEEHAAVLRQMGIRMDDEAEPMVKVLPDGSTQFRFRRPTSTAETMKVGKETI